MANPVLAANPNEITVASYGRVCVAPYGTALPTDATTALDAKFIDVGYVSANGVTFTATPSVTDITSWQSATPTRKVVTARALTVAFQAQQLNLETFALAFGGGTWSQASAGVWTYDPPSDVDPLVDYSLVVDAQDGSTYNMRYVVFRGNVTDAVASTLVRTAAQELPITFSALAPSSGQRAWKFYSNNPNFSFTS